MTTDINVDILKESEYTVKTAEKELGKNLDYSVNSLKDLELLIEYVRHQFLNLRNEGKLTDQTIQSASVSLGLYLGEVIRRAYGGTWTAKNENLKVLGINGEEVSPILYIYERLNKDSQYSLEHYLSDITQDFPNPVLEVEDSMIDSDELQENLDENSSEQVQLLNTVLDEQRQQTKYLSNISTAATLLIILIVIAFVVQISRAIMDL